MIITMSPSDTPTTSTSSFTNSADDKKSLGMGMKLERVAPLLQLACPYSYPSDTSSDASSSSSSISSDGINISNSNSDGCTIRFGGASRMNSGGAKTETRTKKRVSFCLQQTAYFSPDPQQKQLTTEERKKICWYSEAELNVSRDDARMAIHALHHQLQLDAIAASASTSTIDDSDSVTSTSSNISKSANSTYTGNGSWELRCPHDQSKVVCLRGIEKYADAAAKYAGQKRLVNSVLQQQALNMNMNACMNINNDNKDMHLSLVSRTLSEPFKEVARYYAIKSACELESSRKLEKKQQELEQKQREEMATVLLLIMNKKQQHQQQKQELQTQAHTNSHQGDDVLTLSEPMVSNTISSSLKRSRSLTIANSTRSRNVRPCIQSISERTRRPSS